MTRNWWSKYHLPIWFNIIPHHFTCLHMSLGLLTITWGQRNQVRPSSGQVILINLTPQQSGAASLTGLLLLPIVASFCYWLFLLQTVWVKLQGFQCPGSDYAAYMSNAIVDHAQFFWDMFLICRGGFCCDIRYFTKHAGFEGVEQCGASYREAAVRRRHSHNSSLAKSII